MQREVSAVVIFGRLPSGESRACMGIDLSVARDAKALLWRVRGVVGHHE